MGVSVDSFSTSAFTLRNEEAANHIRRLIDLLHYEDYHYSGYIGQDFYADMYKAGGKDLTFKIQTGNYFDGGPDLKTSVVYPPDEGDESEYSDDDYINLWQEIADRTVEGSHFIVTRQTNEKSGLYFGMSLYKDGTSFHKNSYEIEKELEKEAGIKE